MIAGKSEKEANENAKEVLSYLKLENRLEHRPGELSGGEQQRVAIARGIVNSPAVLLADEPTGNLDPHTSDEVFELLLNTGKKIGLSVLVVTHNHELAKRMDKTVKLDEGLIIDQ